MKIKATRRDAYELMHKGALALARAEMQGIRVDIEYCKHKIQQLNKKIKFLHSKIEKSQFYKKLKQIYGSKSNIFSNAQLEDILYRRLQINPLKETKTGRGATDEESLRKYVDKVPELETILQIRKLQKIKTTYLEGFLREQVDGYIHPFFDLHTVATYRSASSSPNFQNIPKRDGEALQITRKALFPRPGHQLLEVDFAGLEVSIAACYHKDPVMLSYLHNPKSDMHGDMAKQIFMLDDWDRTKKEYDILRKAAKNSFVFPQFYGDYYRNNALGICRWIQLPTEGSWKKEQGIKLPSGISIAEHLRKKGITTFEKFAQHMKNIEDDFWNRRFAKYKEWKDRWWALYQKKGYVDTLTGFRCSGVMRKNEVINYPVQGSAFHCLLWSFIELDRIIIEERLDTRLIGQIHDAVVLDVAPNELDYICETIHRVTTKDLPAAWGWIIVPLGVDAELTPVDASWADKKNFSLVKIK